MAQIGIRRMDNETIMKFNFCFLKFVIVYIDKYPVEQGYVYIFPLSITS